MNDGKEKIVGEALKIKNNDHHSEVLLSFAPNQPKLQSLIKTIHHLFFFRF